MDAAQLASLPQFLDVRVVCYTIRQRGFRTRHVLVATTLMDAALWPDEKIAELYGHRWQIETCFNHLKTTGCGHFCGSG
jgi:IS4 transposase